MDDAPYCALLSGGVRDVLMINNDKYKKKARVACCARLSDPVCSLACV